MGEPPGGPPDSTPPHVVVTRPESGAVVHDFGGDAIVDFDEVIDEMAGGTGSGTGAISGIARQIVLSPVGGAVQASWHRRSIHVKPAEGWKPGRVYHLDILPGIVDLRHNVMKRGKTIIFSTGPALPHAALGGMVLQWVEQRALPKAVIRAAPLPDTVSYVVVADSTGAFALNDIPPGQYRLVAIQDANSNRRLDPREAFDTFTVRVDSSANVLLWTFVHDTSPPRLREVDAADSTTMRLTFSQPLDPHRVPDTNLVRLFALPDTTPVVLAGVWTGARFDSLEAQARAVADSLRRSSDTTHKAQPLDSAALKNRKADSIRLKRPPSGPPPPLSGAPGAAKGPARADTGQVARFLKLRLIPTDRFVARAAKPLKPGGKYLVRVHGIVNLTGRMGDGQQVFEVPQTKAAPAKK